MPKTPTIKRILFLQAFPLWGCGSGTYVRELSSEINKTKNTRSAIVCPEGKEKIAGLKIYPLDLPFPVAFTGHPEWPVCRLYKDLSPKEISEVFKFFLTSTMRAVEDFKPDIIHVQHISVLLWVANFIKSLYGTNFIVTAHGTCVFTASQNKLYVRLCQDALRRSKKIVPVSGDTKNWLLKIFGEEFSKKTRVIPGGMQLDQFPPEKEIKIINKKYTLKNKNVVLFAGKLNQEKGVYYLIKAAKDIRGEIYFIGDGPEKKNLEDLIAKSNLTNVHLLGYMGNDKKEELKEFYYRADVFVAPSIWDEPLGLVILEAMAAKTPVIATRKGGIPLVVKDNYNGFLIRPRNSQEIAEKCNLLLENHELRKKIGEAARKTVEKKFTWEGIANKYIRIYKRAFTPKINNGQNKNGKKLSDADKRRSQPKRIPDN
ncbi:MAG: glycosyltransferase family 4 protein [Parcubacteria group bacterium]